MKEESKNYENLLQKLHELIEKQESFSKEINQLKNEIQSFKVLEEKQSLKSIVNIEELKPKDVLISEEQVSNSTVEIPKEIPSEIILEKQIEVPKSVLIEKEQPKILNLNPSIKKEKSNIEKFIGENLINKIGILILIIGVGIGTKYSIENELISPLTRIVLGYFLATGLLGFGIKLKTKYENFSAVLVSGSIAIMYFLTFAAYDFYELIPQSITFALMVIFTIFTIIASLNYNRQVIAHIGFVGAYSVPFLLSDGSGNYQVLFTYMLIINIGILILSFKKNWKTLYYHSFVMTWLIYLIWYEIELFESNLIEKFNLAFVFAFLFFVIFYIKFLAYKFSKQEKFSVKDIFMVMINSFIFYGVGFGLLSNHQLFESYLGLFTLANAIIHFIVSIIIYKKNLADKNIFFLIVGMVLIFITIAIPVQLNGNWVTLSWIAISTLLFWIGRTKYIPFYENTAYVLICLAGFSFVEDCDNYYNFWFDYATKIEKSSIFNVQFLTSILFSIALGIIYYFQKNIKYLNNLSSILKKD